MHVKWHEVGILFIGNDKNYFSWKIKPLFEGKYSNFNIDFFQL